MAGCMQEGHDQVWHTVLQPKPACALCPTSIRSVHLEKTDTVDKKLQLTKDKMRKLSQSSDPSAPLHLVLELLDKHFLVNSPVLLIQRERLFYLKMKRESFHSVLCLFLLFPPPSFILFCLFAFLFMFLR